MSDKRGCVLRTCGPSGVVCTILMKVSASLTAYNNPEDGIMPLSIDESVKLSELIVFL